MEILHQGVCPKYLLECGFCGTKVIAAHKEMRTELFSSLSSIDLSCDCPTCGEVLRTTKDKALK